MKSEIIISNNVKFVLTKNECAYEEVIDTFEESKFVRIVTYNISKEKKRLLDQLRKLNKDCDLVIISNIPGRYATYRGPYWRENAKNLINRYVNKLNPDKYDAQVETFFNFNNHSKIILTDKLAYIGSANFSDESSKSIEAGVIIKDYNKIKEIKDSFVEIIINDSEPYYDKDYMRNLIILSKFLSELEIFYQDLREGFYEYSGHSFDDDVEYYRYYNAYASLSIYQSIVELIINVENYIDECMKNHIYYEAMKKFDFSLSEEVREFFEWNSNLYKLANFDHVTVANQIMEDKYSLYAFNENLDYYADKASEEAFEIHEKLATNSKAEADELFKKIIELFDNVKLVIKEMEQYKSINVEIDNT